MKSTFTFALLLVITFTSAFAQNAGSYLMSTQRLVVRSGPGTNYNPIAEVPQATQVYVISSEYGDWSTIQYKNTNGFVLTKFLAKDSRIADAERVANEAEARKAAAQAAAAQAIAAAERARKAAEEAARKAIAEAEAIKRRAEENARRATEDAAMAARNKELAAASIKDDVSETERALQEAQQRAAEEGQVADNTVGSTSSFGSSSKPADKKKESYKNWEKVAYKTGEAPKTSTVKAKYDYKLDNYLRLIIGKNTDVVVKLYRMDDKKGDVCIREAYVNSGATHLIRNIPAGDYYMKIAYGKDWKETTKNGKRYGVFTKHALYERDPSILPFTPRKNNAGDLIVPSFTLNLDLVSDGAGGYNSEEDNINADEFNQ
ncbi:SH3 domain-containing protein [Aquimarina rhabdastrellae]